MRRALLCLALMSLGFVPGVSAFADIDNASATNVQEGDNDTAHDQSGEASSGDAVGGQVVGVVSSGDTSLDATNSTRDADISTGDVEGENAAASITGLIIAGCAGGITVSADLCTAADIDSDSAGNLQEGDNATAGAQAATVVSGDGVAGQIAGVVTSGTSDLVLANATEDADVTTGDASFENEAAAATLHLTSGGICCVLPSFTADLFGSPAASKISSF